MNGYLSQEERFDILRLPGRLTRSAETLCISFQTLIITNGDVRLTILLSGELIASFPLEQVLTPVELEYLQINLHSVIFIVLKFKGTTNTKL